MNIFEIEKLFCRYKDKKDVYIDVLEVDDISIAKGEITVILGPSGSGKSTFMEAISLMSDTIDPQSKNVWFYSNHRKDPVNLATINKDTSYLQKIRFDNFCFIFQDTNIMGNFNPIENVALPKMVDEKVPGKAIADAGEILRDSLNLRLDLHKPAMGFSGGQKQRFAFARAFIAKGDILFGDEPTGNLDKYNSEKLFNVINRHVRSNIQTGDKHCKVGAIIVTHSIDLALQFADKIIVIVKPERVSLDGNQVTVRGYSNPFFVYHNSGKNAWREESDDSSISSATELEDAGMLPLLNDDGSNRFTYLHECADENKPYVMERLKREIIFYLNNSYAASQKVLVEVAKTLNNSLKPHSKKDPLISEFEKPYDLFEQIKEKVILQVDIKSKARTKIEDYENRLLPDLKALIKGDEVISSVAKEELLNLLTVSIKQ